MNNKRLLLGTSDAIDQGVIDLIREDLNPSFNHSDLIKTLGEDQKRYAIFATTQEEKIISLNIFIFLTFTHNGRELIGCQSGFSATTKEFKGKGIWVKLMKYAERELDRIKVSFIFGFPNELSFPIFKHKLNYKNLFFKNHILARKPIRTKQGIDGFSNAALQPKFSDLIHWKKSSLAKAFFGNTPQATSEICGIKRKIKFCNFTINYLEILAIKTTGDLHFERSLTQICKGNRINFMSMILPNDFTLNHFFKFPYGNTMPLIYKALEENLVIENQLLLFNGSRDTFNIPSRN